MPDEPITFAASLSKEAEKFNLEYKWTVSGGEIIEGQETLIVRALQDESGKSLTLTLNVIGLPQGCENTSSESVFICIGFTPELIGEFSTVAPRIDKAKLDYFAIRLQNNPSAIVYIIEKFEKKTSLNTIKQKNQKIIDYLTAKGIEKDRIVLLNTSADENLTQFISVPAGTPPPTCDDCIIVQLN